MVSTHLSLVHDKDLITIEYCVEAVGDDEHGAIPECIPDRLLDQIVGVDVDGCRGFIKQQHLYHCGETLMQ